MAMETWKEDKDSDQYTSRKIELTEVGSGRCPRSNVILQVVRAASLTRREGSCQFCRTGRKNRHFGTIFELMQALFSK